MAFVISVHIQVHFLKIQFFREKTRMSGNMGS